MADSKQALEPINSNGLAAQHSAHSRHELSTMKLCYLLEDNRAIPGLVTTTDDITTPLAKSWIKVKYITSGETKEYEKDNVKVSCMVVQQNSDKTYPFGKQKLVRSNRSTSYPNILSIQLVQK